MRLRLRRQLLATPLLIGAGFLSSPGLAQTAPEKGPGAQAKADTPEDQPVNEDDTEGRENVPAIVAIIPEFAPEPDTIWAFGTSDTEDIINAQTFAFPAQGANVNVGATGAANVNLRGLGPQRTLVLINGRRVQPGDPRSPFTDVDFIPRALIKRMDYLTGGASAVYGSDAVAGLINFIMDTNFTGLRIDAQASMFTHDNDSSDRILNADVARGFRPPHGVSVNGGAQDVTAAYGLRFADDNGHVLAYASYRRQDPVPQSSRDYPFCSLTARTAAQGAGTPPRDFDCGASSTSANGTFFTNVGTFHVEDHQFAPGFTPFNFGPYNFYRRPDERYSLGLFADYEITPAAKPYVEAMFMNDRTEAQFAPSGDLFNTSTVNCDNPLLSTQQLNAICLPNNTFVDAQGVTRAIAYVGRRNVEGGGREDHLEHRAWRVVAGVRGDVSHGISYDAYYQYGTTRLRQAIRNDFSVTRMQMALDVVANPAVGGVPSVAAGTPICRIRLTDPSNSVGQACVPWNIFQAGGVTPAALDFLEIPLRLTGRTKQRVADANVTIMGDEFGIHSPWADNGINLNVGVEYRKESLETWPDAAFQSGDGASQGVSINQLKGDFDVREAFAEMQIPVLFHKLVNELTLSPAYRYSDYKAAGRHFHAAAYKLGVELAPISGVRFRGAYNRAIRAPNIVELFSPQAVGIGGTFDPCAGPAVGGLVNGFTATQCGSTGVTAGQFGTITPNPSNQYNALFGGSPSLLPEKADTYTVGIVLQPRFISGLSFSADYFDIKVRQVVSPLNFQTIVSQCLATGDPFFCSKIHRAAGSGSLWLSQTGFVDTALTNIGSLRTAGVDVNAKYQRPFGRIQAGVHYASTFLRKLEVDTGVDPASASGDGKFDCAGLFGNGCAGFLTGAPSPKYRHRLGAGMTFPGSIGLLAQWRHFSPVRNDGLEEDCDLHGGPTCTAVVAPANRKIPAQDYFDLVVAVRMSDRFNLRIGANNIFDRKPPIVGSEVAPAPFGNGNTFPQVYDSLGRFIFAGVTIDFGGGAPVRDY